MKAIAFNGSPHKDGNTKFLLTKVLEPIGAAGIATEIIQLGGQSIHGCTGCFKCRINHNKQCIITTDIINDCIAKMVEADAVIIGSPTYFANVTSEVKALIDRAGMVSISNGGLLTRKIGAGVIVHRRGGSTGALDAINHMFLISRMIVPGSTYWNFGVGMNQGDVQNDKEALTNMKDLGETIAWLIKSLKTR
jgi:multimeric flavodoxin WrbA